MKFVFLTGGFLGFVAAALTSWLADNGVHRIFLDASVGALAGAVLLRWFWTVVLAGLRETVIARHQAALAAAAAAQKQPLPRSK